MAGTFQCSVVTPEAVVVECQARFVSLPAHDGEMGVLRGRAPIVVKLDVGTLRIETEEGSEALFIEGGFAEMVHDRLTVLTEQATPPAELEAAQADALWSEAKGMQVGDDASFERRQRSLRAARLRKKLASS